MTSLPVSGFFFPFAGSKCNVYPGRNPIYDLKYSSVVSCLRGDAILFNFYYKTIKKIWPWQQDSIGIRREQRITELKLKMTWLSNVNNKTPRTRDWLMPLFSLRWLGNRTWAPNGVTRCVVSGKWKTVGCGTNVPSTLFITSKTLMSGSTPLVRINCKSKWSTTEGKDSVHCRMRLIRSQLALNRQVKRQILAHVQLLSPSWSRLSVLLYVTNSVKSQKIWIHEASWPLATNSPPRKSISTNSWIVKTRRSALQLTK